MNAIANGCKIVFTEHSIQRVRERFGGTDLMIPNRKIAKINRLVDDGEEYHVQTMLCRFVCKRDDEDTAVVLTVLFPRN